MSRAANPTRPAEGIALMLLAVALFSVMDAMVKWLGASYPTVQIVFFRCLFAFVPLALLIWRSGGLGPALRVRQRRRMAERCLFGLGSMLLFFYCFSAMRLADAIAISFAAPIIVTALSVPLLGEPVGWRRWLACITGFVGVLVMIGPGGGGFEPVALVALLATLLLALAQLWTRRLSKTESNAALVLYVTALTAAASGLALPFVWVTPTLEDLALLAGTGLVGGTALIVLTQAFRSAEIAMLMPFNYTAMIWATAFGWLIWEEVPGLGTWIGFALVLAGGLYIVQREAQLRRRARQVA